MKYPDQSYPEGLPRVFLQTENEPWFLQAENCLILVDRRAEHANKLTAWLEERGKNVWLLVYAEQMLYAPEYIVNVHQHLSWSNLPQFQLCFIYSKCYTWSPCPILMEDPWGIFSMQILKLHHKLDLTVMVCLLAEEEVLDYYPNQKNIIGYADEIIILPEEEEDNIREYLKSPGLEEDENDDMELTEAVVFSTPNPKRGSTIFFFE